MVLPCIPGYLLQVALSCQLVRQHLLSVNSLKLEKNIKIKHTNPYPSCSSQEFSVCVKCREPAVGFCPRQPAGCQCCAVSIQYLIITKPTINKPKSPVCEAPRMMRFGCLTILNGCHQALSSLASLQLPETINALQEKDTPLLMCHMRRW